MRLTHDEIIQILVNQSYIDPADLDLLKKSIGNQDLLNFMYVKSVITKDLVGQAVAEHYKMVYFDLNSNIPSQELILKIPEALAKKHELVAVNETAHEVWVAISDPADMTGASTKISELFDGKKVKFVYSLEEDVENCFSAYRKSLEMRFSKIFKERDYAAPEIVNEIIKEAVEFRASDIHFEPQENDVRIRFRVDGLLKEAGIVPKEYYENILNRMKVLARLRIDEHFSAQDGAIRLNADEQEIDLRVSIVPTLNGQKIVVRILFNYVQNFNLENLGITPTYQDLIMKACKKTYGMILTTGPTGSGKTTTLYAVIKSLHKPDVNITTIEDPVEYRIPGVNQIQVNNQTNLTFAKGLRSIVRQDPNIILVGEIRDKETAEIAVNAALTGHLLLSTFHANDAATSIPRLLDIGVEPFLLASTLNLIIAQRLTRRICENCRYSKEVTKKELKEFIPNPEKYFKGDSIVLYAGKGCERCNGTGYKGRVGIFEFIYVSDTIRDLIMKRASGQQISEAARKEGSASFFEDGIDKVKAGLTTIEELLRVAPAD